MYIDLGAEQLMAAERVGRKIAVEVKSFVGPSEIEDLKLALGQYVLYRNVLSRTEPDRDLYLGIRRAIFRELFEEPIGQLLIENERLKLIVFDPDTEAIVRWIVIVRLLKKHCHNTLSFRTLTVTFGAKLCPTRTRTVIC